jgi:DNA-binding MarR family transcriptional regulator
MKTQPTAIDVKPSAAAQESASRPLPPSLADRAGYLLARTHRMALARAEEALVPLGLGEGVVDCSPRHVGCLRVVAEEGPLSQQELGELIGVDRTTTVAVVDWLESQGFVERGRNPADRRAYALQVTPAGRRWLARADRALRDAEQEFLAPLSGAEGKQLKTLLRRLAAR